LTSTNEQEAQEQTKLKATTLTSLVLSVQGVLRYPGVHIAYKNGSTTIGEIDYSYDPNGRREATWGTYAHTAQPEAITEATYNADNEQIKLNGTKLNTTKLRSVARHSRTACNTGGSRACWRCSNRRA
jgi:hypothetical protein